MLTRSQVAKRLGKSVATIRRIEGALLEPEQDERGVYRFDENEVEALRDEVARGDVSLWQEMRPTTDDGTRVRLAAPGRSRSAHAQALHAATRRADALAREGAAARERLALLEFENEQLRAQMRHKGRASDTLRDELPDELIALLVALVDGK